MNIYRLDNIDEEVLQTVGGKARGLYLLGKCGLKVPGGFVVSGAENDLDIQLAADYYEDNGFGTVAVRSSASAEDGTDYSSAGQYETYLNVSGKSSVKKAIQDCLDSLKSERAESYSGFFNGAKSVQMCVVVQEMIDSDVSGVCFTQSPNNQGLLIEAVPGLGEGLVGGTLRASSYIVSKDREAEGDHLLSGGMLERIASDALSAKAFFGYELDMEWAVKGGVLYWLQARPLTVTETADAFELDADIAPDSILTTCNVGEMLPGAVTPLSLSISVASIDYGMRKMIVKCGAAKRFSDIPKGSCVTNCGNHLFINMSALYAIGDSVIGATREGCEISLCGRSLDDIPKPPIPHKTKLTKMNNARKYFSILMGVKSACRKISALSESLDILQTNDAALQVQEITKKLKAIDEAFWLHYITSAFSGSMSSAIYLILIESGYSMDDAKAKIAGMLEDIDGIESVDILRSLRNIAKAVNEENPEAAGYSAEELAEYLKSCGKKTKEALDLFLQRHGHRAIREAEMRSKSWHMDEYSLCNYLKSVIMSGGEEQAKSRADEVNIDGLTGSQNGILKSLMRYIVKQARKGVVVREFTKSMSIKVLDKFKVAYRHLAELMEENGTLPDADLIFFLTHEEIIRLVNGENGLVKKALARRRILEEQKQFRFDEISVGRPVPRKIDLKDIAGGNVLSGSSISRGKATGKARVVKNVEEANKLEKGEIMVAAFTDIGWSPYYCMLGALVTEVGSALSHGAVVAREYSLPLVANIPYATEIIKTGDTISVDGDSGLVAIIK